MMHQRFIRNAVKAIAADPTVEVALWKGQMRCDFGNRSMESVVEARELSSRRKDRLRGGDQRQSLRNMQWRKMNRRAQLIQHVGCDDLMLAEVRTTVNHAVP